MTALQGALLHHVKTVLIRLLINLLLDIYSNDQAIICNNLFQSMYYSSVTFFSVCSCSFRTSVWINDDLQQMPTYKPSAMHSSFRVSPLRTILVLVAPRGVIKPGWRSPAGLAEYTRTQELYYNIRFWPESYLRGSLGSRGPFRGHRLGQIHQVKSNEWDHLSKRAKRRENECAGTKHNVVDVFILDQIQ